MLSKNSITVLHAQPILLYKLFKKTEKTGCQRLMPVILATWEVEIRRVEVRGWPGEIVRETSFPK
jgi:hypothetical protein